MELQTTQAVVELPLELMDESPSNPREHYDERSLKELAGTFEYHDFSTAL